MPGISYTAWLRMVAAWARKRARFPRSNISDLIFPDRLLGSSEFPPRGCAGCREFRIPPGCAWWRPGRESARGFHVPTFPIGLFPIDCLALRSSLHEVAQDAGNFVYRLVAHGGGLGAKAREVSTFQHFRSDFSR